MQHIDQDTLAVLSAARTDGAALFIEGQLDRKAYQAVAKVIEAAGGKWNRKAGAHLFGEDAAGAIEPILLTGTVTSAKQELGQFDTPPEVAARVVAMAKLEPGMKIYEPSCGAGNLLEAIIQATGTGANLFAHEIDPKRHAACVTRHFRAFGSGGIGLGDFLEVAHLPIFDRVIMNPPFAPRQADIRHVLHAMHFLKPGGLLVAIMAAGVTFRENSLTVGFRNVVAARGGTIGPLPTGSFKASGADVNTVVVTIPA